jgi:hypothetical protein
MAKIKLQSKIDTRGGARTKRQNLSPFSLLIQALWDKFGGVSKVVNLLKETSQAPINWKLRGAVPLEKVIGVSNILNVPALALNFKGWSLLLDEKDRASFPDVVLACDLASDITNSIIDSYTKSKKTRRTI